MNMITYSLFGGEFSSFQINEDILSHSVYCIVWIITCIYSCYKLIDIYLDMNWYWVYGLFCEISLSWALAVDWCKLIQEEYFQSLSCVVWIFSCMLDEEEDWDGWLRLNGLFKCVLRLSSLEVRWFAVVVNPCKYHLKILPSNMKYNYE